MLKLVGGSLLPGEQQKLDVVFKRQSTNWAAIEPRSCFDQQTVKLALNRSNEFLIHSNQAQDSINDEKFRAALGR